MTTAIVTGATSGIGRWIARGLAAAGHHVVLIARDPARGEAARVWISQQVPAATTTLVLADLSSLTATAALGATLVDQHATIDLLVNNAGVFSTRRQVTPEGRELVLAVNHLAPHVLTRALLPALRRAPVARIVNVGSSTSDHARIDPDDLELRRHWGMVRAYSQSKLAILMTTMELARRLRPAGIAANVVHPGAVATGLIRAGGPVGLAWRLMAPFLLTEEQGADTPLHACAAPPSLTGSYLKRRQPVAPNRRALDPALVARVWAATERLADLPGLAPLPAGAPAPR